MIVRLGHRPTCLKFRLCMKGGGRVGLGRWIREGTWTLMAHLPFVPCGGGFINGVTGFSLPSKNFGFCDVASGQIVLVKSASRDDCVSVGQIPEAAPPPTGFVVQRAVVHLDSAGSIATG